MSTERRARAGARRGRGVPQTPFAPMLASSASEIPEGDDWIVEPKYDGVRVIAAIDGPSVGLITRNGRDKVEQFPEVRRALEELGRMRELEALSERKGARSPALVLDGELVAAQEGPAHGRFEAIQSRIHVGDAREAARAAADSPARFVAFDLLLDGDDVLVNEAWRARRARLEQVMARLPSQVRKVVSASTVARTPDESRAMLAEMKLAGAEGVMAKDATSSYYPGVRTRAWRKVKLEHQQEFAIGGFTLPREGATARADLGAILVGTYENGKLIYAGKVGTGFTRASARALARQLTAMRREVSPFTSHADIDPELSALDAAARRGEVIWVRPELVAEVRFNEWTSAGKLRQPVFLGLRDDKSARAVRREAPAVRAGARDKARGADVVAQLAAIAKNGGDGVLRVPASDGTMRPLAVTNLGKSLLPGMGGGDAITKGDLLAYYATIAPVLLPAIADRPLVLKRMPDGLHGEAFYQQRASPSVPEGVRVELVPDPEQREWERRYVGGDLLTLLHLAQLGAISVDPWHGRFREEDVAVATVDYSIIDLDPGPGASFARVIEVAREVKRVIDALGLRGIAKTSGASGLHVVLPLVEGTSAESARLLAELVASRVVAAMPGEATVVRAVKRRPDGTVYVDYLQNIRGKTVASVYSARAVPGGCVSTPLRWREVTPKLDPTRFTITTVPRRVRKVGDLWAEAFREPNDLATLDVLR